MKKISLFLFMVFTLIGCSSATVTKRASKPIDYVNTDFNKQKLVSFIGIDAPNLNNYTVEAGHSADDLIIDFGIRYIKDMSERIGLTLQRRGIALNRTYNYSGAYDLMNLKEYKTNSRYLCFVQFDHVTFTQEISGGRKLLRYTTAIVTYGAGLLIPNKFNLRCDTDYVIRIYDTKTHEFIYGEKKHFTVTDTVNGGKTDLDQILTVYSEYIADNIEQNIVDFIPTIL